MGPQIQPFLLEVPEAELADLRQRLLQTRWPEPETVSDWSQGVPWKSSGPGPTMTASWTPCSAGMTCWTT
jgi:hypothetical protein